MEFTGEVKRAKIKLKCPNPLFEKWLLEWHEEAAARNFGVQTFLKALESLRKYPIVLNSGKECLILEHFDTQLCVKLDRKLSEYKKNQAAGVQIVPQYSIKKEQTSEFQDVAKNLRQEVTKRLVQDVTKGSSLENHEIDVGHVKDSPVKKKKKTNKPKAEKEGEKTGQKYMPNYRSASYALLVALFKNEMSPDYIGYLTKAELQIEAQSYTDASFKRSAQRTYFTAWSSMSQLISKGLIKKAGNPAKYSLTPEGRELAEKLLDKNDSDKQTSTVQKAFSPTKLSPVKERARNTKDEEDNRYIGKVSKIGQNENKATEESAPNVFLPGSFSVVLLVDTAETNSCGPKKEDAATVEELVETRTNFEIRRLKVGDFVWVCRHNESQREVVLPYIVERKRLDDLARSIRDGRFHEQKFRLKQCGLPNLIYLVEGMERTNYGLPATSLLQAIMNTQVSDKFIVKITYGHRNSMQYLATLTTIFTNTFKNKTIIVSGKDSSLNFDIQSDSISLLDFGEFSQDIGKFRNFTVKEMFIKQLVQLHGMSADKAWSVVKRYPTPRLLIEAFRSSGADHLLLSNLEYGQLSRRIGPATSTILHQMYTKRKFNE